MKHGANPGYGPKARNNLAGPVYTGPVVTF